MDDATIMKLLNSENLFNKVRLIFSSECARLEQAELQNFPPTPVEHRRMEFEAVQKIADALGVALP